MMYNLFFINNSSFYEGITMKFTTVRLFFSLGIIFMFSIGHASGNLTLSNAVVSALNQPSHQYLRATRETLQSPSFCHVNALLIDPATQTFATTIRQKIDDDSIDVRRIILVN